KSALANPEIKSPIHISNGGIDDLPIIKSINSENMKKSQIKSVIKPRLFNSNIHPQINKIVDSDEEMRPKSKSTDSVRIIRVANVTPKPLTNQSTDVKSTCLDGKDKNDEPFRLSTDIKNDKVSVQRVSSAKLPRKSNEPRVSRVGTTDSPLETTAGCIPISPLPVKTNDGLQNSVHVNRVSTAKKPTITLENETKSSTLISQLAQKRMKHKNPKKNAVESHVTIGPPSRQNTA
ncbi:unnamed protein product, partial [Adineta steineri]